MANLTPAARKHLFAQRLDQGLVTSSKTRLILAIEQQAKSLKSHTTTLTFIGEFRSI
jgi:hypothetical protein